jgi:hypothetical protein
LAGSDLGSSDLIGSALVEVATAAGSADATTMVLGASDNCGAGGVRTAGATAGCADAAAVGTSVGIGASEAVCTGAVR